MKDIYVKKFVIINKTSGAPVVFGAENALVGGRWDKRG